MEQSINQTKEIIEKSTTAKRGRKPIDPEQLKQNNRQAKLKWLAVNKIYYTKGHHGYECLTREVLCSDCGRSVMLANLSRHKQSKVHLRSLTSKNLGEINNLN